MRKAFPESLLSRHRRPLAQASPINPYYAQKPSPTTAASIAPITSFTTPSMTAATLPPTASTAAPQPPPAVLGLSSEPAAPLSAKPASAQIPNPQPRQDNSTQPQQSAAPNAAPPSPQPPSPFEAQRVTALLDVNRFLLLELNSLQTKPPSPSEASSNDPTKASQPRPNPQSSSHYVDYMRRLQSNLAYLASVADRPHKPLNSIPAWPAIMEPPARKSADGQGGAEESEAEKGVRERYEGLRELWPEWKGKGTS